MNESLFQLVAEYRDAAATLGDLDLDPQTVADTLESLSGDIEHKAVNVAYVAMNFSATSQAIRVHAAAQLARADAIEARVHALREYLANCMTGAGLEKIESPGLRISFRKSSAVQITGEDLIPAEFMRQPKTPPPSPDKAAIKVALQAGQDVPGASIEHRRNLVLSA